MPRGKGYDTSGNITRRLFTADPGDAAMLAQAFNQQGAGDSQSQQCNASAHCQLPLPDFKPQQLKPIVQQQQAQHAVGAHVFQPVGAVQQIQPPVNPRVTKIKMEEKKAERKMKPRHIIPKIKPEMAEKEKADVFAQYMSSCKSSY